MKIIEELTEYTEKEKEDFIKKYSSSNYIVMQVETKLQAWTYDDFDNAEILKPTPIPPTPEEKLRTAKQNKYDEANGGAKVFLESGDALFEFEEGKHIEATDGNIAKLTAYALAFVTGQLQPTDTVVWNTKEDETVELSQEQIVTIINGLGTVQAFVWSVQFPQYVQAIEQSETVEEVEAIEINYTSQL